MLTGRDLLPASQGAVSRLPSQFNVCDRLSPQAELCFHVPGVSLPGLLYTAPQQSLRREPGLVLLHFLGKRPGGAEAPWKGPSMTTRASRELT